MAILSADKPDLDLRRVAPFFEATSVAVVGASQDFSKRAGRPLYYMRKHGFTGKAFAVNPKYDEVHGYACVPSIAALPAGVDLAIIALQTGAVCGALAECYDRGIRTAVILANGFSDAGDVVQQTKLEGAAAATGIQLLGPNTLGCMNVRTALAATSASPLLEANYRLGSTSVVTQSGSLANSILQGLKARDVGIAKWAATGNELNTDALAVVEYLIDDPQTSVIALLVEAGRTGARWSHVGRRARAAGKPVVTMKIGRTAAGRKAAISHTGRAGGSYAAWRHIAERSGLIVVETLAELTDVTAALSVRGNVRPTRALAILGTGGMGVITSDECARQGVQLASLSAQTRQSLADLLPSGATLDNPIDPTPVDDETYFSAAAIAAEDPAVGGVLVVMTSLVRDYVRAVDRLVALQHKAVEHSAFVMVTYLSADDRMSPASESALRAAGVVVVAHPEQAVSAFRAIQTTADSSNVLSLAFPPTSPGGTVSGRRSLSWPQLESRMRKHDLPMLYPVAVASAREAVRVADAVGGAVVMKVEGPGLEHKAEHDAVKLDLTTAAEVEAAFSELEWALKRGELIICVQQQAAPGLEIRVGCVVDPELGRLISVGAGGALTELINDNSYAPCPVDDVEALDLLSRTRVWPLLKRQLARHHLNVGDVAKFVSSVSDVFVEDGQLQELEVNPLIVNSAGIWGVDVLASVEKAGPSA